MLVGDIIRCVLFVLNGKQKKVDPRAEGNVPVLEKAGADQTCCIKYSNSHPSSLRVGKHLLKKAPLWE